MEYGAGLEAITAMLSGFLSWIPSFGFGILSYVFTGVTLYTVARRRGIDKPWLAWIPVVNVWLIGSLSDQYQYVVRGQYKSRRKVLLALSIVNFVLLTAICILGGVLVANVVMNYIVSPAAVEDWELVRMLMSPVMGIMGLAIVMGGVGIAYAIVYFIALYDVYRSMDPDNSTLYLVLSILIPVTEPFFLFFNRQKDGGMPPRRQEMPEGEPRQPEWEAPKDYL